MLICAFSVLYEGHPISNAISSEIFSVCLNFKSNIFIFWNNFQTWLLLIQKMLMEL